MFVKFITLCEYGVFVWSAFFFTFVSCLYLFLITMNEFKKQEEIYIKEFKQFRTIEIEADERRRAEKKVWLGNSK